ncbi:hypothetical protein GOBAR_DD25469 [Gossypium barbadense]|nr:hypothetical protein GOBAR_DD25469 [Gossypium barbadense]
MGYRRSLVVKRHGGLGGLPIAEDVSIGSRSGLELDAIVLERNEGKLMVNRWWWILPKSRSKGDGGGRWRIGMGLNSQGAYYWLVYYRILLPPSTTSNRCG